MTRVEMLAVGKELLIGRTMNSNALWIGRRLAGMGSMIKEITTVDDDLDEIDCALKEILRRKPDFLVVVGGLGPTPDDMTLRGVAGSLGLGLRRDVKALALIREHYARRGMAAVELTPARLKMARLPAGSAPLRNRVGTAPGVRLKSGGTVMFCLPGVPSEMRSIFRGSVEPEVKSRLGVIHRSYVRMRFVGVPESSLAPVLARELKRHPGAYIKSHPRGLKKGMSVIELDLAVTGADLDATQAEGDALAREMAEAVASLGGRTEPVKGLKGGEKTWM